MKRGTRGTSGVLVMLHDPNAIHTWAHFVKTHCGVQLKIQITYNEIKKFLKYLQ